MNTVKRWLAGFLSFAMIFSSAAFSNVGALAVYADDTEKATSVAKVTIVGSQTTYSWWDSLEEAIDEANAVQNDKKTVTIDLLKNCNIEGAFVRQPLTINLNGKTINGDYDRDEAIYRRGFYDDDTNEYQLCRKNIFENSKVTKLEYAKHDAKDTYNWSFNQVSKKWEVVSKNTTCSHCGFTPNEELPTYAYYSTTRKHTPAKLYKTEYNKDTQEWEYYELDEESYNAIYYVRYGGSKVYYPFSGSSVNNADRTFLVDEELAEWTLVTKKPANEGYTLVDGPKADKNGTTILHDDDGNPIIIAKVLENATGRELSATTDPKVEIKVAEATAQQFETWNTTHHAQEGDAAYRWNTSATCEEYGVKWYSVTITVGDEVIFDSGNNNDDFVKDPKYEAKKPHKAGRYVGWQIYDRIGQYGRVGFLTIDQARAYAEGEGWDPADYVIIKEQIDVNGDGDYSDNNVDFNGYYIRKWSDTYTGGTINAGDFNAIDKDGGFTYRMVSNCEYETTAEGYAGVVYSDPIPVKPLADLTAKDDITKAIAAIVTETPAEKTKEKLDVLANTSFSTCTHWNYTIDPWKENYTDYITDKKVERYIKLSAFEEKYEADYSHDKGTNTAYNIVDPTCCNDGEETFKCAICAEEDPITNVIPATGKGHQYVAIEKVKAEDLDMDDIDPAAGYEPPHKLTWNSDYSVATICATCLEDGGEYKYCAEGKKWVKQDTEVKATGHKLSNVATSGSWFATLTPIEDGKFIYDADQDYVYMATMTCSNPNCELTEQGGTLQVAYHSVDGTDSDRDPIFAYGLVQRYNAINIVGTDVGEDCLHGAVTTLTVKDIKDQAGKDVTIKSKPDPDTFGPHKLTNLKATWSDDFEQATVAGTCSVCKLNKDENGPFVADATVTKKTLENGVTEFTASYDGKVVDTTTAYSLTGAKVTFDTSKLDDGNLIEGINGAAAQVPDVTVTSFDGVVIDPSLYEVEWEYDRATKQATVRVYWTEEVEESTVAPTAKDIWGISIDAESDPVNVGFKKVINVPGYRFITNGVDPGYDNWDAADADNYIYDPANTYSFKPHAVPSDATVKLVVYEDKAPVAFDDPKYQEKIEALDWTKAKAPTDVEFHDVGKYFIYAQISKDGYTTYTEFVGTLTINQKDIYVYVNNVKITVGQTPVLEKQAYDTKKQPVTVNWDEFKFYAAGGTAFEDLNAGTYLIWVETANYNVINLGGSYTSPESRVGTITVEPKTDDQKAAEAVIEALKAAGDDPAKLAAAYEQFIKLTDAQKLIVKADSEANSKLAAAEQAYNDKKKADEEAAKKKAAEDAANAAIAAANAYASDATIKALIDALNAALKQGDTAAIQKATADLNNAVAAKKAAPAKKSTPSVKISTKSKTYKAKDLKKKAKSFKIKYSKTSGSGKATFKKSSGSKKLKVSKAGKITVKKGTKKGTYKIKVKLTVAANSKFNAKTVKKTIKVKVK